MITNFRRLGASRFRSLNLSPLLLNQASPSSEPTFVQSAGPKSITTSNGFGIVLTQPHNLTTTRTFAKKSKKQKDNNNDDTPSTSSSSSSSNSNSKDDAPPATPLPDLSLVDTSCKPHLHYLTESLESIRGSGPISPALFTKISVEPYGPGSASLLETCAQVVIEGQKVTITCFDPSSTQGVKRGIEDVKALGVNPVIGEAGVITITMKRLSGDRRKELVKMIKDLSEKCKIKIREVRNKVIDDCKKSVKEGGCGKDEGKKREKEVEGKIKEWVLEVEKKVKEKENEVAE